MISFSMTFKSRKCEWMSDEVHSGIATNSILSLRNALWYVDGSHSKLSHLPDPTPGTDGHYKPFHEVFKKPTTEEHRPSAKKALSN